MFPLKLVRSLVLGETINNHPNMILTHHPHHQETNDDDDDDDDEEEEEDQPQRETRRMRRTRRRRRRSRRSKTAGLLFLPTREIITDTYRLATIARSLGMDLFPTPSLSHIIFSLPTPFSSSSSPSTPSSSFPSTTTTTTTCSFSSSSSSSWLLQNDAVPIPFPSFSSAPLTHLRHFVNLASPAFKLVFFTSPDAATVSSAASSSAGNWDCCSLSLYSRVTGERVDHMEGFCRVLAGKGWTFFKTQKRPPPPPEDRRVFGGGGGGGAVYLFRKVDLNRVRVGRVGGVGGPDGASRVRELRLPHLDFGNAPLRILQYILLMTDDIFCLA